MKVFVCTLGLPLESGNFQLAIVRRKMALSGVMKQVSGGGVLTEIDAKGPKTKSRGQQRLVNVVF